jgi:hypothetical protein
MAEEGRKSVTVDDVIRRHWLEHEAPYYGWIRQVVTLATAALTATVALQGHYVPKQPAWPWLLALTWAALALSVATGLAALRYQYRSRQDTANALLEMKAQRGEAATAQALEAGWSLPVPALHGILVLAMAACFGLGLAALCTFAALNVVR